MLIHSSSFSLFSTSFLFLFHSFFFFPLLILTEKSFCDILIAIRRETNPRFSCDSNFSFSLFSLLFPFSLSSIPQNSLKERIRTELFRVLNVSDRLSCHRRTTIVHPLSSSLPLFSFSFSLSHFISSLSFYFFSFLCYYSQPLINKKSQFN